jgi:hypothetical protein
LYFDFESGGYENLKHSFKFCSIMLISEVGGFVGTEGTCEGLSIYDGSRSSLFLIVVDVVVVC